MRRRLQTCATSSCICNARTGLRRFQSALI